MKMLYILNNFILLSTFGDYMVSTYDIWWVAIQYWKDHVNTGISKDANLLQNAVFTVAYS